MNAQSQDSGLNIKYYPYPHQKTSAMILTIKPKGIDV